MTNAFNTAFKYFKESCFKISVMFGISDVNRQDIHGVTPLIEAVNEGDIKRVRWLLSMGADVNKPDFSKNTPLHAAVRSGFLEITRLLVNEGKAKLDSKNEEGWTPLNSLWMHIVRFHIPYGKNEGFWRTYYFLIKLDQIRESNPELNIALAAHGNMQLNKAIGAQDLEAINALICYPSVAQNITLDTIELAKQQQRMDIASLLFAARIYHQPSSKKERREPESILNDFNAKQSTSRNGTEDEDSKVSMSVERTLAP